MYTLRMLSYDHQGVGWRGVLTFLTGTSLTLRNKLPLLTCCTCFLTLFCWISSSGVVTADGARGFAASCVKDYPHKRFKMAQVNHKQNFLTKTYHVRGRLWGKSYNWNHCCWYPTNGWNMETLLSMLHKKSTSVQKKVHLGLQLDMASQRCLVAVCGFCVATSALALKRRREE